MRGLFLRPEIGPRDGPVFAHGIPIGKVVHVAGQFTPRGNSPEILGSIPHLGGSVDVAFSVSCPD